MNILAKAIQFASDKHVNQTDKGGNAYILHPLRMMMRLRTNDEDLMAIAVLHDVVEDCKVSFDDLRALGMPERVIEGVKALTKQAGETYEQFIDRVMTNKDAMRVKREDLRDNSDITRLKGITTKDVERMQKYMVAFWRIDACLDANKRKLSEIDEQTLHLRGASGRFKPETGAEYDAVQKALEQGASHQLDISFLKP